MPPYNNAPGSDNTPVKMLQPGVPQYAFGSFDYGDPGCRMQITAVSVDGGGNATLSVVVREGNIPSAGLFADISKTTYDSGNLNISGVIIGAVSINKTTGIGTITYPSSAAPTSLIAQSGEVYVAAQEVYEELTQATISQAFAVQPAKGQGRAISWTYEYLLGAEPASISIQLEGASRDIDAEYTIIGTAQTDVIADNHQITASVPENVNFVRINIPSLGSSAKVGATITQS